MALNNIKGMKEILSDNSIPLEVRQTTFVRLISIALQSDDSQLFDWLQSKEIESDIKQKYNFSVRTILDAITFKSNHIILLALKKNQKFQATNIFQIKNFKNR